jgi:hypothetical protein
MVEQLFGSKTRVKLLQLFYSNPNRSFYVREITRKIDEQINSVRRELSNLLSIGIIISENTDNKLYYEVNQKYEFFEPLQQIFGSIGNTKPTGTAAKPTETEDAFKALGKVELVIYTGQFTRDERAGVDILLVGNINTNALDKFIAEMEAKEGKELRYTMMTLADFNYRRQINDKFIASIIEAKKQVVVDAQNLIENEK